jgi:hypothetical protein
MKMRDIRNMSKEDLLDLMGLEAKGSASGRMAGTLGEFALGALVGAIAALMFAPSSGRDMRRTLVERARTYSQRMRHGASDAPLPH